MGLRLLALIASLSLMLIGFGALGAAPASAEDSSSNGNSGTYEPRCEHGWKYNHDSNKCEKTVHDVLSISYEGDCLNLTEPAELLGRDPALLPPVWGPWVFDTTTGKCTRTDSANTPSPTQSMQGNAIRVIRECVKGYELTETDVADQSGSKYRCELTLQRDPTCHSGDILVPEQEANGTSGRSKGARCYTPEAFCQASTGHWVRDYSDANAATGESRHGYCFYDYEKTYCAVQEDGSFVAATLGVFFSKKHNDLLETSNWGKFYTDPPEFNEGDIVPVIPEIGYLEEGMNLGDGGQAFLDRGCLPEPVPEPVVPAPAPAAATVVVPEIDYCPALPGVQWEGYDCLTGQAPQAVAAVEAATVPETAPEAATVPVKEPVAAVVPTAATVPEAVPAGGGSSTPSSSLPFWAFAIIIVGALGVGGSVRRLAGSLLR